MMPLMEEEEHTKMVGVGTLLASRVRKCTSLMNLENWGSPAPCF